MAAKQRPGSAKDAMGQQQAAFRRGAPGKRFVGDRAEQSQEARRVQREKVERMAEIASAERRAEEIGVPVSAILAELIQDTLHLARTLVVAPFRLWHAWRTPRTREV
jgi:hypothetical protein